MRKIFIIVIAAIIILSIAIASSLFFYSKDVKVSNQLSDDLIFISNPNNAGDIIKWDSSTKELSNLTNNQKNYLNAIWSPDGKKVAFTTSENSKWKTYTMNTDGTGTEEVKGTSPLDTVWGWSPDGRYLLLQSYRDVNEEIYCLDIKTAKAVNLTNNSAEDYMPVWSPDGKKIAFISNREKQGWFSLQQLYIMDLETGTVNKINTDDKAAGYPVWSPDSRKLAVSLEEFESVKAVYIIDINDNKMKKIETEDGKTYTQFWSADGEHILIDHITSQEEGQMHEPFWINLKNGSKEQVKHEMVPKASFYRVPSFSGGSSPIHGSENTSDKSKKEKLAIVNGTLIDGNGGEPAKDVVILIENGLIQYCGSMGEQLTQSTTSPGNKNNVQIPDSYRKLDVNGGYILPGFINSHVHYGYDAYSLKEWAKQGVTTVRDLGTDIKRPLFDMHNNINNHPRYSRLIMAGPIITVPGGYPQGSYALQVTSPKDAREKTLDLIEKGVDVVKVALETGEAMGTNYPILSTEELKAIVEMAHSKGKRVTAHVSVMNSSNIEMAVHTGVDDIAHNWMVKVDDNILKQVVDKGIYLVPTHEVLDYNILVVEDNLNRFIKLGGKVALGSDYGGDVFGKEMELGMPMFEIKSMLNSGMTPMQVVTSATKNAAIVCGWENKLGTIEKGKIADLLILHNSPLEKIDNLKNVEMVIKDGCVITETKE